jgi:dTDP-glucose 4,6-dehydratase
LTHQRQRPQQSEVFQLVASTDNAAQRIGWRAEIGLEEGLARTIAWIDAHREHYRPHEYGV